jgi:hypothetical protein
VDRRWEVHWRPRLTYSIYLVDAKKEDDEGMYLGVTDVDFDREHQYDEFAEVYRFESLREALESDEASPEWDRQGIDEEFVAQMEQKGER